MSGQHSNPCPKCGHTNIHGPFCPVAGCQCAAPTEPNDYIMQTDDHPFVSTRRRSAPQPERKMDDQSCPEGCEPYRSPTDSSQTPMTYTDSQGVRRSVNGPTARQIAEGIPPEPMTMERDVRDREWCRSFDAKVWTAKWLETIAANPSIPTDEGTMLGWFANAIMAGYDYAKRAAQPPAVAQPCDVCLGKKITLMGAKCICNSDAMTAGTVDGLLIGLRMTILNQEIEIRRLLASSSAVAPNKEKG